MIRCLVLAIACHAVAVGSAAHAQDIPVRVTVEPRIATIGEPVRYHAYAVLPPGVQSVKWLPLEIDDEAVTVGPLTPSRRPGPVVHDKRKPAAGDTLHLRTVFQMFRTGEIMIPGATFRIEDTDPPILHTLPAVRVEVASVLPADQESPPLEPARGPLEAPWWERVPWTWVVLGASLVAAAVAFVWMRRRRRRDTPVTAVARAADPSADALEALRALRAEALPQAGRFAEHAFALSAIAKRFLEATASTPQPGDTTPELLAHLRASRLGEADVKRVAGLLRMWDQVKFARAPSTAAEAERAEASVEALVRRSGTPAAPEAAA